MEKDQEMKHVCKFCNKKFPSGRSLGGHIRSHLINSTEPFVNFKKKKLSLKKLGDEACDDDQNGYGLRENPKKAANKFAKSAEDSLLTNKICKHCGKGFQSWKALFGHMKCHSEKALNNVEEDCWNSRWDNEATVPNRKKISRRIKRDVSDSEKDQEEVAMSLILLSRDVGIWGGPDSIGESSCYKSEFLEARSISQTDEITKAEVKNGNHNGGGSLKLSTLKKGKLKTTISGSKTTKFELKASGIPRNRFKMKKTNESFKDGKLKNSGNRLKGCSEIELSKKSIDGSETNQPGLISKKKFTRKRKAIDQLDHELTVDYSKKVANCDFDIEFYEGFEKKSKFDCTVCNKKFHSYQSLGGHKASHKKIKIRTSSRIHSSEKSTETELSAQIADSKLIDCCSNENFVDSKTNKGHECPICFKVFSSGQALGGHKRSHLIGETRSNQSVVIQKPISEVRDFLDLNLPPPDEEESIDQVGSQQWWIGSNHKHQELVGLLRSRVG